MNKRIKVNTQAYFRYQIKIGKVDKPTACQKCGRSNCRIVAHHPNYDDPDLVKWVCSRCHKRIHMEGVKPFNKWPNWLHEYLANPDHHKDGYISRPNKPRKAQTDRGICMEKRYFWHIQTVVTDEGSWKELRRYPSSRGRNKRIADHGGEVLAGNSPEVRRINRILASGKQIEFPYKIEL